MKLKSALGPYSGAALGPSLGELLPIRNPCAPAQYVRDSPNFIGPAYPEWYRRHLDRTTVKTSNKNGLPKAASSSASPRRPSSMPPRKVAASQRVPTPEPESSPEDIGCTLTSTDHRLERADDKPRPRTSGFVVVDGWPLRAWRRPP